MGEGGIGNTKQSIPILGEYGGMGVGVRGYGGGVNLIGA